MKKSLLALALAAMLATQPALSAEPAVAAPTTDAVIRHYANLVQANYADTLAAAQAMQQAIDAFLARPAPETLRAAQQAWRAAREFYGQTEAYRFYGGPIDDDDGPEGRLNGWPMDESYVDGVKDRRDAGLINNRAFVINNSTLMEQNERGGEENIATGWHAIEFLLWGQDLSETGPGNRAYTDFVDGNATGLPTGLPNNADRRRQYLQVIAKLLIDDLGGLTREWAAGRKYNYRARFEKGGLESLRMIFVGLGSLSRGELAGERLEVALNSQDQEDEHSCFSDNTHRDAVTNALGVENVWLGRYKRADGTLLQGPAPRDLVALKDAALAERTSARIADSVAKANAIKAPFDREIVGAQDAPGRLRIQATVDSLVQQSKDLVAAANAVGITKLTLAQP
ncbi:MAG: iron-regulated protein [Hydrogenophilales bacterium 28-61-23]|nr:MAG: iron-regulated protein [Hydrogenophilales bacterium 28-61-23]